MVIMSNRLLSLNLLRRLTSGKHGAGTKLLGCQRVLFSTEGDGDKKPKLGIVREERPQFAVLSPDKLKALVDQDQVYLVDVREPFEVDAGRVPAKRYVHVPLAQVLPGFQLSPEEFERRFGSVKPGLEDGSEVVVMCRSGVRSTWALQALHHLGFDESRHFPGGWLSWNSTYPDVNVKGK